jgi:hypothetical protein
MFTTQRPLTLAGAGVPKAEAIGVYANSTDNPRTMPFSGTRDPSLCASVTVEVTYYDVNGNTVGTPSPTVITPTIDPNDGSFWDASSSAPAAASSMTIVVKCGGTTQQTISNIGLQPLVQTSDPPSPAPRGPVFTAAKVGTNSLEMQVDNPAASDGYDSDNIVIVRHISHNQKNVFFPHYHTPNPGAAKRIITVGSLSPGRYATRLIHIPGDGATKTYAAPVVKIT